MAKGNNDEGGAPKKASRKKSKQNGGAGHNIAEVRKVAEDIFKRCFTLQEEMDSAMGEFRVDFKNLYEEGANKAGVSRAVIRGEFNRMKALRRLQDNDNDLEGEAKEETERLRAALDGTPFAKYLEIKLAAA